MEKCLYYNDHQTAATLMIDDLSFVSITQNGKITPQTDWGGGIIRGWKSLSVYYGYFSDMVSGNARDILFSNSGSCVHEPKCKL